MRRIKNNEKIKNKANSVLEAVAFLESRVKNQINKDLLPAIKKITEEIRDENYGRLDEFKGIAYRGCPEASGTENNIFSIDVHVSGISKNFGTVLDDLIEEIEKVV